MLLFGIIVADANVEGGYMMNASAWTERFRKQEEYCAREETRNRLIPDNGWVYTYV